MADLAEIEQLTQTVAAARGILGERVQAARDEVEAVHRRRLPGIRQAMREMAGAVDRLRAAIAAAPELFEKPRTKLFHGVRVGYRKQRGEVVITDEERTIRRIRELLPEDQAELLIRQRESVHKPAVYDLAVSDLKRLGIAIEDDTDEVVIKAADTDLDKLVDALLKDAAGLEEAA